jgi:pimeloyl-ACP methyl ester carboxylesterase
MKGNTMIIKQKIKNTPLSFKVLSLLIILIVASLLSIVVSFWPKDYFWVKRNNAIMPVWVRGNLESGVFIIFTHGGPGSSGTLESIIEVNPANGRFDHKSPFEILESRYAVVYWDQRHSGLSRGSADPNDSRPEDFGEDLAVVVGELEIRYDVQRIFLIGQSWGHFVASSYMTKLDVWRANLDKIDGYIIYKGNHEQGMAYSIARERILERAEEEISNYLDVQYWQEVREFYQHRTTLTNLSDLQKHNEYVDGIMGDPIQLPDRIWSSIKASVFSPFNGFVYYSNNKRTIQSEDFISWVAFDPSMREVIHRIDIPTLLVYGENDLIAPVEVGEYIYNEIGTDEINKEFLVLEQSRHGAENGDREILQKAIILFIEKYR